MTIKDNAELKGLLTSIANGMMDYMADGDVEYTREHVQKCCVLLEQYLADVDEAEDRSAAMAVVEATVLKLNSLNEEVDEELIETGEREQICEYIMTASALKGFSALDEDITEEWREW